MVELKYDASQWREIVSQPVKTVQLFITDRCNLRCQGCFFADQLRPASAATYLPWDRYCALAQEYQRLGFGRVTLLGGEPTLHPDLLRMIRFNRDLGMKTTVYTNGRGNNRSLMDAGATVRIGVHGIECKDKSLLDLREDVPFTLVYMITQENLFELPHLGPIVSHRLPSVKDLYLSSIREIDVTGDFWADTPGTVPNVEYAQVVQAFLDTCHPQFRRVHIATRGVLTTAVLDAHRQATCRFCNVLPDGKIIMCPLDISVHRYIDEYVENRPCNKAGSCVLQKIVLERVG